MGTKVDRSKEQKRQKKALRKRKKDIHRHKSKSSTVMSENAIQHQMIANFGNIQNFVKNVNHLAEMFKTDEDLSKLRFDPDKIYEKIDLAGMRDELENMYASDDFTLYDEEYESVWKAKRKEVLDDLLTDEFVEKVQAAFVKLSHTKKGFKKDHRAILAGKLLIEGHIYSLTEAPAHENALWEILYNAALKENKKELPEPAPETEKGEEGEAAAEPAADTEAEPAAEPAAEPTPEPAAEPAAEQTAEPAADPEAETPPEPEAEPESGETETPEEEPEKS